MLDKVDRRAVIIGAVIGAMCGAGMGMLYQRWRQARPVGERKPIKAGQIVRLGTNLAALARQVLELIA